LIIKTPHGETWPSTLIHEYAEVKNERIWVVATERIPELVALLKPLLPQTTTADKP